MRGESVPKSDRKFREKRAPQFGISVRAAFFWKAVGVYLNPMVPPAYVKGDVFPVVVECRREWAFRVSGACCASDQHGGRVIGLDPAAPSGLWNICNNLQCWCTVLEICNIHAGGGLPY